MIEWNKSEWFNILVSTCREAISNAESLLEESRENRIQSDMFIRDRGYDENPQELTIKKVVEILTKAIIAGGIRCQDMGIYEKIYSFLPPLQQVRDAICNPEIQNQVKTRLPFPSMEDPRIPQNDFLSEINQQVFERKVDL